MIQNEMMDRPVINPDMREYFRKNLPRLSEELTKLQEEAKEKRVPVIPHETVAYLKWFLPLIQATNILEIGTAIGFSALVMAEVLGAQTKITTIERNPLMLEKAKVNIKQFKRENQINILEGQADEHLKELSGPYDFIFMDSAKAKYYDFFPNCMRVLKTGGVLAVDDVLQGGTILDTLEETPKRRRTIHKKMNLFLDAVLNCPYIEKTIIPVGDGLLLITKNEDVDFEKWMHEFTSSRV